MIDLNAYMRVYHMKRYYKQKNIIIDILGGKCIKCGSNKKLEIDHIDRKDKRFSITRLLSHSKESVILETKKCQLLCKECHIQKTIIETGKKPAKGNHGTLSSYRYCKCDLCRKAKQEWMIKYKNSLIS